MAELTLADLVAWDNRLHISGECGTSDAHRLNGYLDRWGERELTWVVTARASAPMLPLLRGGELVILPNRVLIESGVSLPLLLRELASHDVTGVVLDLDVPEPAPVPVLHIDGITAELENDLNRLLTQRRGDIYRTGTELGRRLATLTAAGGDLQQVLSVTASTLAVSAAVVDARAAVIASTGSDALPSATPANLVDARGWRGAHLAIPLASGEALWMGPVSYDRRALIRVAGERVAVAAEASLVRAAQARPRGPARASALAALLTGPAPDAARAAATVGLPADTTYRVALASPEVEFTALQRSFSPLGTVHEAGLIDGATAIVIELRGDAANVAAAGRHGRGSVRDRTRTDALLKQDLSGVLALSGVAPGAASLTEAACEARYVAALIHAGLISRPVARFDALDDLGPFRLLYRLWGTSDLALFITEALGDLVTGDRRGTLRQTLLAYLTAGGSHVDAAAALGIHRNTLSYRLKQITSLTGREPTNPDTRLVLHLALLAKSLPPAPAMP
ncbi:MAG: PucR family transcriptional regulator [Thermomicrobiales bacterium]